jgi:hypothetical protein
MKKTLKQVFFILLISVLLSSCLGDDSDDAPHQDEQVETSSGNDSSTEFPGGNSEANDDSGSPESPPGNSDSELKSNLPGGDSSVVAVFGKNSFGSSLFGP